jgi:hypothetical protein
MNSGNSEALEAQKWRHGGPWTLTIEAWRLKTEPWRVFRLVVADLSHFDEEQVQDPNPDPY